MSPTSNPIADRSSAILAAAAREFNDEFTVILTGASESLDYLEEDDPVRVLILELQGAAHRCKQKAWRLLQFAARQGIRPSAAAMDKLIDD